jgi:prepilin-type N-terminal cleavage/methylation domain-containing protein
MKYISRENAKFHSGEKLNGFSLTELLVVIAIIAIMATFLVGIGGGSDAGKLTKAAYDVKGVLAQGRAYAMAQNTYVYVGFQEVDAVSPTSSDGIGMLVVAAAASKSGQRMTNVSSDAVAISKALTLKGVHMTNATSLTNAVAMGSITRPADAVDLSEATAAPIFQIPWPPGASAKNLLKKVIEFDPQGLARVPTNAAAPSLQPSIEIALVPARGNTVPDSPNHALIQINGITGGAQILRP